MAKLAFAGQVLPAGLITKAKAVAAGLTALAGFLVSGTTLALVPDQYDPWVLVVGGFLTVCGTYLATFQVSPTLLQDIDVKEPAPPLGNLPDGDGL